MNLLNKALCLTGILALSLLLSNCTKKFTDSTTCKNKNLKATADGNAFESCVITVVPYATFNWIQAGKDNDQIHLYIPRKTGTFALGDTSAYSAVFNKDFGKSSGKSLGTDSLHSGTVTITSCDVANKTISGTFSFSAIQKSPAGGTATANITNGTFADIKW